MPYNYQQDIEDYKKLMAGYAAQTPAAPERTSWLTGMTPYAGGMQNMQQGLDAKLLGQKLDVANLNPGDSALWQYGNYQNASLGRQLTDAQRLGMFGNGITDELRQGFKPNGGVPATMPSAGEWQSTTDQYGLPTQTWAPNEAWGKPQQRQYRYNRAHDQNFGTIGGNTQTPTPNGMGGMGLGQLVNAPTFGLTPDSAAPANGMGVTRGYGLGDLFKMTHGGVLQ